MVEMQMPPPGKLGRRDNSFWEVVKRDLAANSHRSGISGIAAAYMFRPGFACAFRYRLVVALMQRGPLARLAARLLWVRGSKKYSCYISYLARIGPGLALPHPTGIVIGNDVEIGENVTIFQHVTLGRSNKDLPSSPRVGDGVVVYAGAVVVGNCSLGDGAVVGANVVVSNSIIPAGALVLGPRSALRL